MNENNPISLRELIHQFLAFQIAIESQNQSIIVEILSVLIFQKCRCRVESIFLEKKVSDYCWVSGSLASMSHVIVDH